MIGRRSITLSLATGITLVAAACDERDESPIGPSPSAVKFWDAGASVGWNERATDLAAVRMINASRLYAYLSLAQFRAAEAAQRLPGPHAPVSAAIGGASAAVLSAFFPADVEAIESALDAQERAEPWPGAKHENFVAGEALGRQIGASVLAFAEGDGVGLTDPGVPPVGPGFWVWNGLPIARGNYGARPFFLTSSDEFRPGPPPAFGSADYLTALAEVHTLAVNRTPEQLAIVLYWHLNQSPFQNAAMNGLALDLIREHRRKDAEAARILFLANAAAFDANIGCFDAKFHYWFIRPPQADPAIIPPFVMPNHPSYPSAHSCISGAMTGVLAAAFPSERGRVDSVAEEASLSRMYAGIHYRFDVDAGLALGRAVAAKAVAADLDRVATLP
jgi:hypothetical protein